MPLRSVFTVDVDDQKFRDFKSKFDEYQREAKKMPAAWRSMSAEQKTVTHLFERSANELIKQAEAAKRVAAAEKESGRLSHSTAAMWTSMAHSTHRVSGNIAEATRHLLRWTGIVGAAGGLLGAGGLWGLDRLATSVTAGRRSAMGLGLTFGEQRAFALDFGRLVDPDSFLNAVSEVRANPALMAPFSAIGMTRADMKGDTEQVALHFMDRLRTFALRTPSNLLGLEAQAYGLTGVGVSLDELRRFKAMSPGEYAQQRQAVVKDAIALNVSAATQRKWNDFTTQMSRAGKEIEKVLIVGLTPLAPSLKNLSSSFETAVAAFLRAPELKVWIKGTADALNHFAATVGTPQFDAKVKTFVADIGVVADKLEGIMKEFHWVAPIAKVAAASWAGGRFFGLPGAVVAGVTAAGTFAAPKSAQGIGARNRAANFWWGTLPQMWQSDPFQTRLLGLVRQLENSGDSAVSPKGAVGRYQVMPSTAKMLGYDPSWLESAAYNKMVASAYLSSLEKRYHEKNISQEIAEVLAAYNAGPGVADRFKASGDNPAVLPAETRAYLARAGHIIATSPTMVKILIENQTGAKVTTLVRQAPQ